MTMKMILELSEDKSIKLSLFDGKREKNRGNNLEDTEKMNDY